jgi:hypothetical protein
VNAKALNGTLRAATPGRELGQQAISESCVVLGRPRLRSVDSEQGGPRDSAPKDSDGEADAVFRAEGNTDSVDDHGAVGSPGVRRTRHVSKGPPGTWEACTSPREQSEGEPHNKPQASMATCLRH